MYIIFTTDIDAMSEDVFFSLYRFCAKNFHLCVTQNIVRLDYCGNWKTGTWRFCWKIYGIDGKRHLYCGWK